MSPASYLTAPPRVAASIVAPALPCSRGTLASAGVSAGRDDRLACLRGDPRLAALAHVQAHLGARRRSGRAGHGQGRGGRAQGDRAERGTERLAAAVAHLQARSPSSPCCAPRTRRAAASFSSRARRGAAQVTRVAAIDLGTNATRLLVADVEDGDVSEVLRRTRITRLGEGVDARRRLLPVPIARVRNVLDRLPPRGRGARRRAHARRRDERGARRRERRGVPRRGRVVVRLRDAPALRRRGGGADAARRRAARPRHGRRRHRRRLDRADRRRASPEPRPRLRAADRAPRRRLRGDGRRRARRRCRRSARRARVLNVDGTTAEVAAPRGRRSPARRSTRCSRG